MTAEEKLAAICALLEQNGCDCDCEHHMEEHDDDCEWCFACQVNEVVSPPRKGGT